MERALSLAWSSMVHMTDGFFARLPNILVAIATLTAFVFGARLARKLVLNLCKRTRLDETLCHALGTIMIFFVNLLGALVAATIVFPSFSPGNLVAGLGITSVAVGFAFKDILENFFAGILLLWQKPFRIGDEIRTNGFEGTVEDIDIRSTRMKTSDGELVVVPNGAMLSSPIVVLTGFAERRVKMTVAAPAGKSTDEMRQLILDVLRKSEFVQKEPEPLVYQTSLGSSLDIFFWANSRSSSLQRAIDEVASSIQRVVSSKPTVEQSPESKPEITESKSDGKRVAA
ncbi:MAG: mechanosensitive ion channel [Cyanobacteria bacterium SZAS-4]|nr:mechanosensitive ion channel [Cyanobacteria bacterium SZAS-4]